MPRKKTDYRPVIGQVSAEFDVIPGVSHRLVKLPSGWVHTRYAGNVLTTREELTQEAVESLLTAAQDRGDAIQGPAMPDIAQVYVIREA